MSVRALLWEVWFVEVWKCVRGDVRMLSRNVCTRECCVRLNVCWDRVSLFAWLLTFKSGKNFVENRISMPRRFVFLFFFTKGRATLSRVEGKT